MHLNLQCDRDGTSRLRRSFLSSSPEDAVGRFAFCVYSTGSNEALLFQADQWVPMRGGGGRRRKGFVVLGVGS
jgi:hypothetical protein